MLLQTFCSVPGQEPFDFIVVTSTAEAMITASPHELDATKTVIGIREATYRLDLVLSPDNLARLKAALAE
jgi:hypothetical protein